MSFDGAHRALGRSACASWARRCGPAPSGLREAESGTPTSPRASCGSGVFSHSVVLQEGARVGVVIRSRRPSRRGGSTA